MKIEVGKMYRVGGECNETGNVIKITNKFPFCGTTRFQYETISGKMSTVCIEFFDKNSIFAKNLTPFTAEEKVVILRNGTTVTATQYVDGEKCGTGVAKCSPEDEFDFAFGAKLALVRSLNCEPKENIWISIHEGNLVFETDLPESEVFVW